jgi:hypothetical protein
MTTSSTMRLTPGRALDPFASWIVSYETDPARKETLGTSDPAMLFQLEDI